MLLTTIGFLGGMALGVRFSVLVLVPGLPLAWTLVIVDGLTRGASVGSIALGMTLAAFAIQAGYLAGFGLQWALHSGRARMEAGWAGKPVAAPDRAV